MALGADRNKQSSKNKTIKQVSENMTMASILTQVCYYHFLEYVIKYGNMVKRVVICTEAEILKNKKVTAHRPFTNEELQARINESMDDYK